MPSAIGKSPPRDHDMVLVNTDLRQLETWAIGLVRQRLTARFRREPDDYHPHDINAA
jgi:hypothetical protein